ILLYAPWLPLFFFIPFFILIQISPSTTYYNKEVPEQTFESTSLESTRQIISTPSHPSTSEISTSSHLPPLTCYSHVTSYSSHSSKPTPDSSMLSQNINTNDNPCLMPKPKESDFVIVHPSPSLQVEPKSSASTNPIASPPSSLAPSSSISVEKSILETRRTGRFPEQLPKSRRRFVRLSRLGTVQPPPSSSVITAGTIGTLAYPFSASGRKLSWDPDAQADLLPPGLIPAFDPHPGHSNAPATTEYLLRFPPVPGTDNALLSQMIHGTASTNRPKWISSTCSLSYGRLRSFRPTSTDNRLTSS
ncbi:unnamed protein product, partial [Protopolystoma xenopodis]